jgi:hypothetical protein
MCKGNFAARVTIDMPYGGAGKQEPLPPHMFTLAIHIGLLASVRHIFGTHRWGEPLRGLTAGLSGLWVASLKRLRIQHLAFRKSRV